MAVVALEPKMILHICDESLIEATSPTRAWRIESPCRACLEGASLEPASARRQAA